MGQVKPIPEGFNTVTPHLVIKDAASALAFYKKAFGAEETMRMPGPGGHGIMHAEFRIGDSVLMCCDEFPMPGQPQAPTTLKGTTFAVHLYVKDVDALFKRAVDAGATPMMPPADMFWGDRYGKVVDPYGHQWGIATHKADLSPEEIGKRAEEFFKTMG